MNHISEDQWIEYHYGESTEAVAIKEHLHQCATCAAMGAAISRDLTDDALADLVKSRIEGAERGAEYGESVWQALQGSLTPYVPAEQIEATDTKRFGWLRWSWSQPGSWRDVRTGWVLAGVAGIVAVLTVVAFFAGRAWEKKRKDTETAALRAADARGRQARQSVLLVVVNDHLDRSVRLLAELDDPEQAASDRKLCTTARELLSENRLYRASAMQAGNKGIDLADGGGVGDASMRQVLSQLEPVLVELANEPDPLSRAEMVRLRKELGTNGLILEIRVLRSREPEIPALAGNTSGRGTV